jgi:hydrogenase maturation protease
MSDARILIAGIGNVFLGDDAFGVEVAQRLMDRRLPEEARVIDFGIRGLDLAYALSDNYENVILVDAAPRGGDPGTLYVIEPKPASAHDHGAAQSDLIDMHDFGPEQVLRLARTLASPTSKVLLIGCEPQPAADQEYPPVGLSPAVKAAVDEAVRLVESTVVGLLREPAGERRQTAPHAQAAEKDSLQPL